MSPVEVAIVRERRFKTVFFILSLVLFYFIITRVENMLVSTILAVSFYYMMAPLVDLLERKGIARIWATTIPFLAVALILVLLVAWGTPILWHQFSALQANSDKYLEAVNQSLQKLQDEVNSTLSMTETINLKEKLGPQVMAWSTDFFKSLPVFLSQSFTVLFLAPLLTFFMLLDGRDFIRRWLSLVPNHIFELALNLNEQISSQLGGFIRARLIESLFVSAFTCLGLLILGFPSSLVLGLAAGIMNIIPYVGPVVALIPALIIGIANGASGGQLGLVVGLYVLVQILDAGVLVPFLVAKIVNLHPVTVILAVIAGAQLAGMIGMIICIPVVSALKVTTLAVYRHLTDFRT